MRQLLIAAVVLCGAIAIPARAAEAQTSHAAPTAFNLSPWYFPRPAQILTSRVESNDAVASDPLIIHFGTPSLASLGRTTGYYMRAVQTNMDTKGKLHPVFTHLLVSQFGTADQAATAFQQEKAGWEQLVVLPTATESVTVQPFNGQQFGDLSAEGLYVGKVSTSQGNADVSFLLFKRGTSLIEVWQVVADSDMQSYGKPDQAAIYTIGKALDAIAQDQAPPALPKHKVDFSIMSVRFERNRLNFDLTKSPVTHVRSGATVEAGAYIVLRDAPQNAVLHETFKLSWHGHSLQKRYSHTFGGTYPLDYYHFYVYDLKLKNTGVYKINVTLKIGSVTRKGSASVQVTKSKAARFSRSLSQPAVGLGAASLHAAPVHEPTL